MADAWIELELADKTNPFAALRTALERADSDAAAHAYESLSLEEAARFVDEEEHTSPERARAAAVVVQQARDFANAARLFERGGALAEAATLYDQTGSFAHAAALFARAGSLSAAGAAYERAGRVERALLFYQQAKDPAAAAACLSRHERFAEAAALYREQKNVHGEVEMLRKLPSADPTWLAAQKRLAELLESHGHLQRAVRLLTDAARTSEAARADPEVVSAVARLLERMGKSDEAGRVRATGGTPTVAPHPASRPEPAEPDPVLVGEVEVPASLVDPAPAAYAHLKAVPLFASLALDDLRDLYRIAQEETHPAGAVIIEQGQRGRGLLVIHQGTVEVFAVGTKGGAFLNRLDAGAYVGEISLVRDEPTSARVVAVKPVRALLLSCDAFKSYLAQHPDAARLIFEGFTINLAERVRALSNVP